MSAKWVVQSLLIATLSSAAEGYCPGADPTLPGYHPDYYSVRQEFARAKFVVEATAEREIWLGNDGQAKPLNPPFQLGGNRPFGFDPYMGAYFDVRVQRRFKGNPPGHLRLFSENSTARFFMNKGKSYLLFVTDGEFDPPISRALTVDNCGNSDAATRRSLLRQIERLSHR
jgi:hypothetical protein